MPNKIEDLLPEEYQFNREIAEYRELIEDEFNELIAEGDVISVNDEMETPIELFAALSEEFAVSSGAAPDDLEEVTRVIYRGFQFGARVAGRISPGVPRFVSLGYLAELEGDFDAVDTISEDVQQYLNQRPELLNLITLYIDEVDPSSRYGQYVERAAGFILMNAEKQVSEQHMFEQLETSFSNPHP